MSSPFRGRSRPERADHRRTGARQQAPPACSGRQGGPRTQLRPAGSRGIYAQGLPTPRRPEPEKPAFLTSFAAPTQQTEGRDAAPARRRRSASADSRRGRGARPRPGRSSQSQGTQGEERSAASTGAQARTAAQRGPEPRRGAQRSEHRSQRGAQRSEHRSTISKTRPPWGRTADPPQRPRPRPFKGGRVCPIPTAVEERGGERRRSGTRADPERWNQQGIVRQRSRTRASLPGPKIS